MDEWWKSKTVWVSVAGCAYAIGGYFAGYIDAAQAVTALQVALSALFIRFGIAKGK